MFSILGTSAALERAFTSSTAVGSIKILEKIVQNKNCPCLYSQDTQKCQRLMDDFLPTLNKQTNKNWTINSKQI